VIVAQSLPPRGGTKSVVDEIPSQKSDGGGGGEEIERERGGWRGRGRDRERRGMRGRGRERKKGGWCGEKIKERALLC